VAPTTGINNPTVPGHAVMPGPAKTGPARARRGKVVKVPKSLTSPPLRMPKSVKPRDAMRLRVPKGKVIK
jgi:hypothetical protein